TYQDDIDTKILHKGTHLVPIPSTPKNTETNSKIASMQSKSTEDPLDDIRLYMLADMLDVPQLKKLITLKLGTEIETKDRFKTPASLASFVRAVYEGTIERDTDLRAIVVGHSLQYGVD